MRLTLITLLALSAAGFEIGVVTMRVARHERGPAPQAAREAASRFAERLRETRDFGAVIGESFTGRFMECHIRAMREGKENAIFSQAGPSVPRETAVRLGDDELRRYLVVGLNLFYLKTLHRLSTRDLWGAGEASSQTPNRITRLACTTC